MLESIISTVNKKKCSRSRDKRISSRILWDGEGDRARTSSAYLCIPALHRDQRFFSPYNCQQRPSCMHRALKLSGDPYSQASHVAHIMKRLPAAGAQRSSWRRPRRRSPRLRPDSPAGCHEGHSCMHSHGTALWPEEWNRARRQEGSARLRAAMAGLCSESRARSGQPA